MSDFYTSTQHKARKDHVCDLCTTKILKGQDYIKVAGTYAGDFFSHKLHIMCDNHIIMYLEESEENEYSFDEVNNWLREKYCFNCCHYDDSLDCMLDSEPAYCDRFMLKEANNG